MRVTGIAISLLLMALVWAYGVPAASWDFIYGIKETETREEFVERTVREALVPYAIVQDGQWFAKGEMGWFGIGHDEMNEDEWTTFASNKILEADPDDLLTVVDCHI